MRKILDEKCMVSVTLSRQGCPLDNDSEFGCDGG